MNYKKIQLITCVAATTTIFCLNEQELQLIRRIAKEEAIENSRQTVECYAWATKLAQGNNNSNSMLPTSIHNHIHNATTSASSSNPITTTIATNETELTKKEAELNPSNATEVKKIDLQEILDVYKWYIGGGIITTWYLYTFYHIHQTNKLLNNPLSWCLFKEEIPVTRLTTIKRTELFKELHLAICKKYLNSTNYDNDQKIMLKFLADLSSEKSRLESYLTCQTVISNCYLSKLFPTFKKTEHIEEVIARLNFLMDLYIEFFIIKDQNK